MSARGLQYVDTDVCIFTFLVFYFFYYVIIFYHLWWIKIFNTHAYTSSFYATCQYGDDASFNAK